MQIIACASAVFRFQRGAEKHRRLSRGVIETLPGLRRAAILMLVLRQLHAGHLSGLRHGLGKADAFEMDHQREDVAALAAAETFVGSGAITDMKARALFGVERAAGPIIASAWARFALIHG